MKAYSAVDHVLYVKTGGSSAYAGATLQGSGEPDSDFIGAEYVNDAVSSIEGAKGDVQDSVRVAEMGRVTFTCQWGSVFNKQMSDIYKEQQKGIYLESLQVKNTLGAGYETLTCKNPKIVKLPNYSLGTAPADRAYVFNVHNMELFEPELP